MASEAHIRPTRFTRPANLYAEGSCLVEAGNTRVLCTASVVDGVPDFLTGSGRGWLTAEYGMLPRSTRERKPRPSVRGRPDGREFEIQRLIGRSLRAAIQTGYLGERTIFMDCDVLQADGGTRTAAVNGGMLALVDALVWLHDRGLISGIPLVRLVAGISVGKVDNAVLLDLDYEHDARAQVDMNVIMGDDGRFIEVQGTAEGEPMSRDELDALLDAAASGIRQVQELQKAALGAEVLASIGKA